MAISLLVLVPLIFSLYGGPLGLKIALMFMLIIFCSTILLLSTDILDTPRFQGFLRRWVMRPRAPARRPISRPRLNIWRADKAVLISTSFVVWWTLLALSPVAVSLI